MFNEYLEEPFEDKDSIVITFSSVTDFSPRAIVADEIMLPKSQIRYEDSGPFQPTEIEMPEWLAYEKGLI